jgi:hypothetical protein
MAPEQVDVMDLFRRSALVPLLAAALMASPGGGAAAAMLGDAALSYSALRTVTVDGRSYSGMVFHVPGHERHEQEIAGIAEVILLDAAAKEGVLLLPLLKSYVDFAFPPLMAELDDPAWRRRPLGQETVNGMRTTKYRIDHTAGDGSRAEGFAWVSAEGVLMRLEGSVAPAGATSGTAITMELSHVKPGPQERRLFQLPAGLFQLPSAALQAFLTGRPP